MENGTAWSNSSESSDDSSSPQLSLGLRHAHKNLVQPELQATTPAIEISFTPRESATSTPTRLANQKEEEEEEEERGPEKPQLTTIVVTTDAAGKQEMPNGHTRFSRSLSHISENSVDAALTDRPVSECLEASEVPSVPIAEVLVDLPVRAEPCIVIPELQEPGAPRSSTCSELSFETAPPAAEEAFDSAADSEEPTVPSRPSSVSFTYSEEDSLCISPKTEACSQQNADGPSRTEDLTQAQDTQPLSHTHTASAQVEKPVDRVVTQPVTQESVSGLEEALNAVVSSLDDYRGQFPELQVLEQELRLLEETLTVSD